MALQLMQIVCLCMIGCALGNIVPYAEAGDHEYPLAAGPHLRGTSQGYAHLQDFRGGSGSLKTFDTPSYLNSDDNQQEFVRTARESIQDNIGTQAINQIYKLGEALQQEIETVNSGFSQANIGNVNYDLLPNTQSINTFDQNKNGNQGSISHLSNQNNNQQLFQNQRSRENQGVNGIINIRTQTNGVNQDQINQESVILRGGNNNLNFQPYQSSIKPSSNLRINQDESRQLSNLVNRRQSSILINTQRTPVNNPARILNQIISQESSINNNQRQNNNNQDGNHQQHHHAAGPHLRGGSLSEGEQLKISQITTGLSQLPLQTYSSNEKIQNDRRILTSNANANNQQRVQLSNIQAPLQLRTDSLPNYEIYDTEQGFSSPSIVPVNLVANQSPLDIDQNTINSDVIRTERQTNQRTTRRTNVNQLIKNPQRVPSQSVNRRQNIRNNVGQPLNQATNSIRTQQRGNNRNTNMITNLGSTRQLNSIRAQRQGVNQNSNHQRNQGNSRQYINRFQAQPGLSASVIPASDNLLGHTPISSVVRSIPISSAVHRTPISSAVRSTPISSAVRSTPLSSAVRSTPISSAVRRPVVSQRSPINTGNQRFGSTQSGIRSQQTVLTPRQSNNGQGRLRSNTFGDTQGRASNNANQRNRQGLEQNIVNVEDIRDGPHSDGSYYFRITNSDGTIREEGGVALDPCTIRVTGSYQYIAPTGEVVTTQFISDQNGYQSFQAGTRADWIPPVRQPIAPPMMMGPMPPCPSGKYEGGNGGPGVNTGGQGNRPLPATSAITGQSPVIVLPTQAPPPRPVIAPQPVKQPVQTPRPFVPGRPGPVRPPITPRPVRPTRPIVTPRPVRPVRPSVTPRPVRPISPVTVAPVSARPAITNFNSQTNDNSNIPPGGSIININTQNNDNTNLQQPGGNILNFNTQNNRPQGGFGNNGLFNFNSQNNNNG